jgi:hypothetical protein
MGECYKFTQNTQIQMSSKCPVDWDRQRTTLAIHSQCQVQANRLYQNRLKRSD